MIHWLAVNFPPSTLPVFLLAFGALMAANAWLFHRLYMRGRR